MNKTNEMEYFKSPTHDHQRRNSKDAAVEQQRNSWDGGTSWIIRESEDFFSRDPPKKGEDSNNDYNPTTSFLHLNKENPFDDPEGLPATPSNLESHQKGRPSFSAQLWQSIQTFTPKSSKQSERSNSYGAGDFNEHNPLYADKRKSAPEFLKAGETKANTSADVYAQGTFHASLTKAVLDDAALPKPSVPKLTIDVGDNEDSMESGSSAMCVPNASRRRKSHSFSGQEKKCNRRATYAPSSWGSGKTVEQQLEKARSEIKRMVNLRRTEKEKMEALKLEKNNLQMQLNAFKKENKELMDKMEREATKLIKQIEAGNAYVMKKTSLVNNLNEEQAKLKKRLTDLDLLNKKLKKENQSFKSQKNLLTNGEVRVLHYFPMSTHSYLLSHFPPYVHSFLPTHPLPSLPWGSFLSIHAVFPHNPC